MDSDKQDRNGNGAEAQPGRRNFLAWTSALPVTALTLPFAGCGDGMAQERGARMQAQTGQGADADFVIDTSIVSPNQDSRVRELVLHYTALNLADSLAALTNPPNQVSAHYLVPDAPNDGQCFKVYALVPEARRAWHAGISYWEGDRMLNAGSIGVETVNLGFPPQDQNLPLMQRHWYPYPADQVAVIGKLAADIVKRHQIAPYKVVGHADIAPGRKTDPGPLFPWFELYRRFQVGAWPEDEAVEYYRARQPYAGDVAGLQAKLLAYGYDAPQTGTLDQATINVIASFQMHFRPERYDGVIDVETAAILDALLEKYFGRGRAQTQARQARQLPFDARGEKGVEVWPLPEGMGASAAT